MLVLTRLEGEAITIDGGIVVTVLEIERGSVRIGIDAPKDIKVLRGELDENTRKDAGNDDFDPTKPLGKMVQQAKHKTSATMTGQNAEKTLKRAIEQANSMQTESPNGG